MSMDHFRNTEFSTPILDKPYTDLSGHTLEGDVNELWNRLLRRKAVFFSTLGLGLGLVVALLLLIAPTYKSETLVSIDLPIETSSALGAQQNTTLQDDALVLDQAQILGSREIVGQVVDRLNLIDHPDFKSEPGFIDAVIGQLPFVNKASGAQQPAPAIDLERQTITEKLQEQLTIVARPGSRILEISASATEPALAAEIANTLVAVYGEARRASLNERIRARAVDFDQRAATLRQELIAAEQKLEAYRTSANLSGEGAPDFAVQELQDLNEQLIIARDRRIEADSRLAAFRDTGGRINASILPEALDSRLIQRLREGEAEIETRIVRLEALFRPNSPELRDARAELNAVRGKINRELQRLANGIVQDARIAAEVEREVTARYNEAAQALTDKALPRIRLAELEREAAARRALLETYLARASEYAAQLNVTAPDFRVRVISAALPGVEPVWPKPALFLALGIFVFAVLGLVLALVRDYLDPKIWSQNDAEQLLAAPLFGYLPELAGVPRRKMANALLSTNKKPNFDRAVRDIAAGSLMGVTDGSQGRALMVTSSTEGEGKSTLSTSLARSIARSGKRVVVLDADFYRPSLHTLFGKELDVGLLEILHGRARFSEAVMVDDSSGAHLISGGMASIGVPDAVLLERLNAFISKLCDHYDVVIVDTAPLLALPEIRSLSSAVDATLMCLRWGKVEPSMARETIRRLNQPGAAPIGLVLSRITQSELRRHGYA